MGLILLIVVFALCLSRSVLGHPTLAPMPGWPLRPGGTTADPCSLISNQSLHRSSSGTSSRCLNLPLSGRDDHEPVKKPDLLTPAPRRLIAVVKFPADLAAACLRSVPNHRQPAIDLIGSLRGYVQWHGSLAWLRRPPQTYPFPAVDVDGGLASLSAQVAARRFESEYDFQVQLGRLFASARDSHLGFEGDVFKPFLFKNDLLSDVVSVSADGIELPKLHHMKRAGASAAKPGPAIVRINGLDAAVLVEQLGYERTSLRDVDGQWNSYFPSYAVRHRSLPLSLSAEFFSKSISIEYEDGTRSSQASYAVLRPHVNFTGVRGGQTFYRRFCTPGPGAPFSRAGHHHGVGGPDNAPSVVGSFLNRTYYNDVAVLAISTFGTDESDGLASATGHIARLRSTVSEFLTASRDNHMKRLVIDLTGTSGTSLPAALTILHALFPDVRAHQVENARLHDGLVSLGMAVSNVRGNNVTFSAASTIWSVSLLANRVIQNILPGHVLTPGGREFASVSQVLRPVHLHGDAFIAYQQRVYDDMPGPVPAPQPDQDSGLFHPADVVVLTDGTCQSACAFFYETTRRLNVTAVVVGGRPHRAMIESATGTRGAQLFPCGDIQDAASSALHVLQFRSKDGLHPNLGIVSEGLAIRRSRDPVLSCSVGGKNMFSAADVETPLQFGQQSADCRIFYTWETVWNAEAMWRRVVDAVWTTEGQKFCVARAKGRLLPV